ncbi:hypothetical protein ACSERQ_32490, partial [Pseudomonas aeruginosa]
MSDDESAYSDAEKRKKGDEGANFLKSRQQMKMSELDEQLAEYIAEWRKQRAKEEEELRKLKEKQKKRKVLRAEEEKKLTEQKKADALCHHSFPSSIVRKEYLSALSASLTFVIN